MQPAPLNVDPAPRRAASEATGRCRSAPEARGFAPVCNRRRRTASLRCARARHDTSLVITRCVSSHVARHDASRVMTRRLSSAPACNRRRRTSTPLRDEPRAKRPADVDRRRKHEATHRCALGAGGLRPFAALGLVMTRRASSRVARYRTSLVIARQVSSRVARHRPSPVISACMQPAPSDIDPAPRRAASEATGSRDRGCCSARRFAERHPRSTGNEPTQPGGPLVPSRLCNAAPQRSLRTALRAESGRTSDSPSIPPGEVDLAQIPIFSHNPNEFPPQRSE